MTIENDNLPDEGGTGADQTSEDDTASITDYWEPGDDDEPDTPEAEVEDATDEGEAEAEGQPDDAQEVEPEPAAEEPAYADETSKVKLADGTEVSVADLIQGRMLQADYSRKTNAVAEQRKAVEADAQRIEQITSAFIDHLSSMIPDDPPHSLALTDPGAYTRKKAQHDAAVAQVQKLIEIGGQPKQITDAMSAEDQREALAEENRRLVSMFPETGTQDGRQRFWGEASQAAMDLGFSAEELNSISDHRLVALAHWARKGMAADKAKAEAKAKVAKAPPATPQKPGQGANRGNGNAEAMRKLARSGSFKDAMAVDFD